MSTTTGRFKDRSWGCHDTYEGAHLAVLMDIRDELKKLNGVMACPNVARGFIALVEMNRRDEINFKARVTRAVARKLKAKR